MIKLTSPPYAKWVDGKPTNQTYVIEAWVNPRFVISVEWDSQEKKHSVVTVMDAMVKRFNDVRQPSSIVEIIKHDLKQYL